MKKNEQSMNSKGKLQNRHVWNSFALKPTEWTWGDMSSEMEPWQYHDQTETDKWQLGSGHWWIARQNTVPSRLKWFWAITSLPAIKDHHIMSMNIYEPKNTDRKGKGITDEKASSSTTLNFIHPHISHSCWFFGGQGRLAEWTKMFFSLVAMLFLTMPVIHGGRWPVQESRCFPHWCHQ